MILNNMSSQPNNFIREFTIRKKVMQARLPSKELRVQYLPQPQQLEWRSAGLKTESHPRAVSKSLSVFNQGISLNKA